MAYNFLNILMVNCHKHLDLNVLYLSYIIESGQKLTVIKPCPWNASRVMSNTPRASYGYKWPRLTVHLHISAEVPETPPRPRSMAPPASRNSGSVVGVGSGAGMSSGAWGDAPLARALFAYLSSGENQLSFLEGDLIALMGECQVSELPFVDPFN